MAVLIERDSEKITRVEMKVEDLAGDRAELAKNKKILRGEEPDSANENFTQEVSHDSEVREVVEI